MIPRRFRGACDASAATLITGTSFFVAASDEDYILRVFDWDNPGVPVSEVDVTAFLKPVDPKKEPDIEGSAQVGNRVYWIGSHGSDKDGNTQESRQRLFATEFTLTSGRADLRTTGRPYKKFLTDLGSASDLAEFDLLAAAALPPEAPGGLNIEGLTTTPEGHLLVGFRNPVPQGRALVVSIRNPADVVDGGKPANVAREALLDLGNRGVRALEPAGPGKYLVLAGKFDDTKDFGLFLWDRSSKVVTQVLDGAALNVLNPEELLLMPQTAGHVNLVSDDGDALVGGTKCKKASASERSFRITPLPVSI